MPSGKFKRTKKHKQNIGKALKGRVFTLEHKRKISKYHCDVSKDKNPRYIDGRTLKTNTCYDCGKKLADYRAKRCSICAKLQELGPNWNNGSSKLPYHANWIQGLKKQFAKEIIINAVNAPPMKIY